MKTRRTLALMAALSGHFVPEHPLLASAEGDQPPAGGGAKPPPAAGPPAVPPPAPPPPKEPFAVFETEASFMDKVDRAVKKRMKDLGFEGEEGAKKVLEEHAAAKKQAEDAERAKMSEIDRLRADLAARDSKLAEEQGARERAEMNAHLNEVFAEAGIKNRGYARHLIVEKLSSMGDDEVLDERVFLADLAKDPQQAIALGLAEAPKPAPVVPPRLVGPNTSPGAPPVPPPPPAGGGGAPPPTAFDKSQEEFRKEMQRRGVPGY